LHFIVGLQSLKGHHHMFSQDFHTSL
jgi:hypothetical protein